MKADFFEEITIVNTVSIVILVELDMFYPDKKTVKFHNINIILNPIEFQQ